MEGVGFISPAVFEVEPFQSCLLRIVPGFFGLLLWHLNTLPQP